MTKPANGKTLVCTKASNLSLTTKPVRFVFIEYIVVIPRIKLNKKRTLKTLEYLSKKSFVIIKKEVEIVFKVFS